MECVANLTTGAESLDAARLQMNISGRSLIEMLGIMEMRYAEMSDAGNVALCKKLSDSVLNIFRSEGGKAFEISGYEWITES